MLTQHEAPVCVGKIQVGLINHSSKKIQIKQIIIIQQQQQFDGAIVDLDPSHDVKFGYVKMWNLTRAFLRTHLMLIRLQNDLTLVMKPCVYKWVAAGLHSTTSAQTTVRVHICPLSQSVQTSVRFARACRPSPSSVAARFLSLRSTSTIPVQDPSLTWVWARVHGNAKQIGY